MSNPGDADDTPVASVQQLADHIAAGCKPPSDYRIGTEHEKFGFQLEGRRPPPYEPGGIRAVLDGLAMPGAWDPIIEAGKPIGLKGQGVHRTASVSLEPAGQLELSGGLLETLGPVKFWLLHAGICAAGAVMLLVFGLAFGRLLKPAPEPDLVAEPAAA